MRSFDLWGEMTFRMAGRGAKGAFDLWGEMTFRMARQGGNWGI